jgi:poly(hydroxyalkanoate) granule-associated protein
VVLDLRLDTEILAAEGMWVIVRFTARGTQQTALFGLGAGQTREVTGVGCFTVREHGISDLSVYVDGHQLATQLESGRATADDAALGSTASADRDVSWVDRLTGGAREVWLAGLGALAAAGEQGERVFHSLVEQGRAFESAGRERVAATLDTVDTKTQTIGERARSMASSGQEYVRDVASSVRERLDAPTRAEFDELKQRLDLLAARLESTGSAPATPPAVQSGEGLGS